MARPTTAALRAEISRLQEQAELAERLEHAEGDLSQAQGELAGVQQQLAVAKTRVLAEEARLKEVEQHITDARASLQALGRERQALEKELYGVRMHGEEWTKTFVAQLHQVVPTEPAAAPEEALNE